MLVGKFYEYQTHHILSCKPFQMPILFETICTSPVWLVDVLASGRKCLPHGFGATFSKEMGDIKLDGGLLGSLTMGRVGCYVVAKTRIDFVFYESYLLKISQCLSIRF